MVIRGSYYLSGDSVLFQAGIMDVASGRVLRSFDPVGAPVERATDALEALRERIAGGLSPLVNRVHLGWPGRSRPGSAAEPPRLPRVRGGAQGTVDWEAEAEHYRRAARLDSTFVAPLIQLAFVATWERRVLDHGLDRRRARAPPGRADGMEPHDHRRCCAPAAGATWRRRCAFSSNGYRAYPRSVFAQGVYAWGCNPPTSRGPLGRFCGRSGARLRVGPREAGTGRRYWWRMAVTWHMLGEYRAELGITDRWRDSAAWEWQVIRGRALAALGREREVMELSREARLEPPSTRSRDTSLTMATELAAHGHPRTAMAMAESVLARLELEPDTGWSRASEHRLGEPAARSDGARAGRARADRPERC